MPERILLQSEGEELESFLEELQRERQIKEITGWETGFPHLSRMLDGVLPGLYLLIGPPAAGKTSFAKQLLDQVARLNGVPATFFSFAERKKELRIKTLARLSGLENREIRRGSAYLLHWYGVPKAQQIDAADLAPGWDKLRKSAEEAKPWLDLTYIIECTAETDIERIEEQILEVERLKSAAQVMVAIDDCQRLKCHEPELTRRLAMVANELQETALRRHIPILAVWPNLREEHSSLPQIWSDRAPSADVILVMTSDLQRSKKLTEPNQAVTLHIVKNRGGESGQLAFEFYPAFSQFVEIA